MLFYLNGTSSSGKSSVANEIQVKFEEPCFYFSIDTLLYSLLNEDLEAIMGKRPYRNKMDWTSIFHGYLASVAALISAGNNVIADLPIYNDSIAQEFFKNLSPIREKVVVRLECPIEVLETREKARGDRAPGIAKRQFATIHNFLQYDITVDTNLRQPAEIAESILRMIE